MKIKIINQIDNPLFSRKQVQLEISAQTIPSTIESQEIVAKEFKSKPNLVRIRDIKGKFGMTTFTINADVYDSAEEFKRIVKRTKKEIEAEKKAQEERIAKIAEEKKAKEEEKKAAEEAKKAIEQPAEEKTE